MQLGSFYQQQAPPQLLRTQIQCGGSNMCTTKPPKTRTTLSCSK
uniref:Uncharacterized protein n=1 Tax=Arundo donax TaxID=35708 RepID=A0A0A8YX36_ARUDO